MRRWSEVFMRIAGLYRRPLQHAHASWRHPNDEVASRPINHLRWRPAARASWPKLVSTFASLAATSVSARAQTPQQPRLIVRLWGIAENSTPDGLQPLQTD